MNNLLETKEDAGLRFLKQRVLCLERKGFLKSMQVAEAVVVLLATATALVAAMVNWLRVKVWEWESHRKIEQLRQQSLVLVMLLINLFLFFFASIYNEVVLGDWIIRHWKLRLYSREVWSACCCFVWSWMNLVSTQYRDNSSKKKIPWQLFGWCRVSGLYSVLAYDVVSHYANLIHVLSVSSSSAYM